MILWHTLSYLPQLTEQGGKTLRLALLHLPPRFTRARRAAAAAALTGARHGPRAGALPRQQRVVPEAKAPHRGPQGARNAPGGRHLSASQGSGQAGARPQRLLGSPRTPLRCGTAGRAAMDASPRAATCRAGAGAPAAAQGEVEAGRGADHSPRGSGGAERESLPRRAAAVPRGRGSTVRGGGAIFPPRHSKRSTAPRAPAPLGCRRRRPGRRPPRSRREQGEGRGGGAARRSR